MLRVYRGAAKVKGRVQFLQQQRSRVKESSSSAISVDAVASISYWFWPQSLVFHAFGIISTEEEEEEEEEVQEEAVLSCCSTPRTSLLQAYLLASGVQAAGNSKHRQAQLARPPPRPLVRGL